MFICNLQCNKRCIVGFPKKFRSNPQFSQPAMQRNVALQVAGKVELSSTFRNVARQVAAYNIASATCKAILSKSANQSVGKWLPQKFIIGHVANCEQKFRACDIPSETCNVLQSSLLRCKLQMKLLRVT